MSQKASIPSNRPGFARGLGIPTFDPESTALGTTFPLDGHDIATVSNERLIEIFRDAPRLYQSGPTKVVRLSQTLVMKGGPGVLPSESANMKYAAKLEGLRVPRVYRSFDCPAPPGVLANPMGYIVMDYVKGSCLKDSWSNMNMEQRQTVVTQTATMLRNMRSTPLDFVGPVGGGVSQGLYFTDWSAGPFEDRRAMEDWFNHKLQVCRMFKRAKNVDPFHFPTFVFTHGDVAPRNIIVDDKGLVWLIDWQNAGSYPPQMESAVIANQFEFEGFAEMLGKQIGHDEAKVRQLGSIEYALTTGAFI